MNTDVIVAICAILGLIGAGFVWVIKKTLAPLAQAMTSLSALVALHTVKIEEQGIRITVIETKQGDRNDRR